MGQIYYLHPGTTQMSKILSTPRSLRADIAPFRTSLCGIFPDHPVLRLLKLTWWRWGRWGREGKPTHVVVCHGNRFWAHLRTRFCVLGIYQAFDSHCHGYCQRAVPLELRGNVRNIWYPGYSISIDFTWRRGSSWILALATTQRECLCKGSNTPCPLYWMTCQSHTTVMKENVFGSAIQTSEIRWPF